MRTTLFHALVVRADAARQLPIALISHRSRNSGDDHAFWEAERMLETKIGRYARFESIVVSQGSGSSKRTKDLAAQKKEEGVKTMKRISDGDFVVCFDERGKKMDSVAFSREVVKKAGERGYSRIAFVLGGPYGIHEEVLRRANVTVSLSDMVMNHSVARIVVLEQIYRAWTILTGSPYHH